MELIVETGIMKSALLGPLMSEGNELVSIFVKSLTTARSR
jgi:hypothetical protein